MNVIRRFNPLVVLIIIVIIGGIGAYAYWKFPSNKQSADTYSCPEVRNEISLDDLQNAHVTLVNKTIPATIAPIATANRIDAQEVSFLVPSDNPPRIQKGTVSLRVEFDNYRFVYISSVDASHADEITSIVGTSECRKLREEFSAWAQGKTDLTLVRNILNLSPTSTEVSPDLLLVLLSLKDLYLVAEKTEAYEIKNGSLTLIQVELVSSGGRRFDIFDETGNELGSLVFSHAPPEALTNHITTSLTKL